MNKKLLIALLLAFVMCFSLAACGGINVEEELTAEPWYNVQQPFSHTMEFYETGTGSRENIIYEGSQSFTWTEIDGEDNAVRITYNYTGASCDYILVDNDGVMTLQSADGEYTYVREADLNL